MDDKKLETATKLKQELELLKQEEKTWDTEFRFAEIKIRIGNGYLEFLPTRNIDLDVLKTLTLSTIRKKIKELQAQYDNL